MVKMSVVYEGQLHCKLTHQPSGAVMHTDAPTDHDGKGESFSPTDLLASALGSCLLTVMGIYAKRNQLELTGTSAQIVKEMITSPERRVGKISVTIQMAKGIPMETRAKLEAVAHTCPVHKSLHPDVQTPITFVYPD